MIIYKATNTLNGKCYIGQTTNSLKERKYSHLSSSKKGGYAFQRAIRKHGWDTFTWEVLCECETKEELDEMEFHYIKQYHSHGNDNGYNMTWGGDVVCDWTGRKHTKDTLLKLSEGKTGKKNPFYGKKHTEESLRLISESSKGKKNPLHKSSIHRKKADKKRLKRYHFITPDGVELSIIDMVRFCESNTLNRHNMYATWGGKQSNHKGYRALNNSITP